MYDPVEADTARHYAQIAREQRAEYAAEEREAELIDEIESSIWDGKGEWHSAYIEGLDFDLKASILSALLGGDIDQIAAVRASIESNVLEWAEKTAKAEVARLLADTRSKRQ